MIDRYREFLPVTDATPSVSLGEGSTPLVRSQNIGDSLGCKDLYFKLEGCNPTGSFKDRGMVMAIAKALEAGKKRLAGDTQRQATGGEVKDLRREMQSLKELVADLSLENRLLKKSMLGAGDDDI